MIDFTREKLQMYPTDFILQSNHNYEGITTLTEIISIS